MLLVTHKDRLRKLLSSDEYGEGLAEQIAYLASYGFDGGQVSLLPDKDEPYISIVWLRDDGTVWMNGGLVRSKFDGKWSVNT